MSHPTYRIVFTGDIAEGESLSDVKKRLSTSLRMKPERIEKLFSGQTIVFKKNLDQTSALRYKAKFEKNGARCHLETDHEEVIPTPGTEAFNQMRNEFLKVGADIIEKLNRSEKPQKSKSLWTHVRRMLRK